MTSLPHALYQARSNGHSFVAKIDSGASCNCISKTLWNKIKTSNKLIKSNITLTGAGGSKLAFLGFCRCNLLHRKVYFHRRIHSL